MPRKNPGAPSPGAPTETHSRRAQEASSAPSGARGKAEYDGAAELAAAVLDGEQMAQAELQAIGSDDPPVGVARNGVRPAEWQPDRWGLPPDCPVLPLGTEDGIFYFLDTIGQLRALKDGEMAQAGIRGLFMGRHLYLHWAWPRISAAGTISSWRPERAAEALISACARHGSWSPLNNVRGRGMWRDSAGRLVVHCGNTLITHRGDEGLGEYEGKVYPTRPPIARPWPTALKRGPAARLVPHFRQWNWVRPEIDPILLIGAIGVGYLGGALEQRPASYILGDRATGKSSLQNDTKALMGEWQINTGDTTAAGLYQQLKFDCLPVAIDEFEAKADNRKAKAVIELMRISYTGAPMNRGGDNHKGTQFYGRSAFTFSSINMPPMEPQDISRLAVLRLQKLKKGQARPIIEPEELAELGRKVQRRLIDNWHRWPATQKAWREFLASCGHDGRGQDTFGTLMAVADLVIGQDAVELELDMADNATEANPFQSWRPHLEATALSEFHDARENWQLCLTHLLSKRIEAWRGGTRHTVGEVLTEFIEGRGGGLDGDKLDFNQARKLLEQTGLTLMKPRPPLSTSFEILVPHNNPALFELFNGSKWAGELGSGSWTNALRQASVDGTPLWREGSARINGEKAKGTAFSITDIIIGETEAQS